MPSSSSFCYSILFSLSFCKLSPLELVVFFVSSSFSFPLSREEEEEEEEED